MSSSCYGRCVTLRNNFSAQPLYSICLQSAIKDGNTANWVHSVSLSASRFSTEGQKGFQWDTAHHVGLLCICVSLDVSSKSLVDVAWPMINQGYDVSVTIWRDSVWLTEHTPAQVISLIPKWCTNAWSFRSVIPKQGYTGDTSPVPSW